jgi:hypothetical protein
LELTFILYPYSLSHSITSTFQYLNLFNFLSLFLTNFLMDFQSICSLYFTSYSYWF